MTSVYAHTDQTNIRIIRNIVLHAPMEKYKLIFPCRKSDMGAVRGLVWLAAIFSAPLTVCGTECFG